jgi:hypothetical protein
MRTSINPARAHARPGLRHRAGPCGPAALAAAVLAALLAAGTPLARADPVTYTFTGVVDDDEAGRGYSSFSGSFTFNSSALDAIADPATAAYAHSGAPWGLTLAFDGAAAFSVSDSFNVLVGNDLLGTDQWGLLAQDALQSISMSFIDLSGLVFGSDALPLPAGGLLLSAFGSNSLRWETGEGALQGHMDTLACSAGCQLGEGGGGGGELPLPNPNPVPEPPSLLLAALGLALMLKHHLRRAP